MKNYHKLLPEQITLYQKITAFHFQVIEKCKMVALSKGVSSLDYLLFSLENGWQLEFRSIKDEKSHDGKIIHIAIFINDLRLDEDLNAVYSATFLTHLFQKSFDSFSFINAQLAIKDREDGYSHTTLSTQASYRSYAHSIERSNIFPVQIQGNLAEFILLDFLERSIKQLHLMASKEEDILKKQRKHEMI